MAKEKITIEIEGSPSEVRAVKAALQVFAKLKTEDRKRLQEIAKSPKALNGLAENWNVLQSMVG